MVRSLGFGVVTLLNSSPSSLPPWGQHDRLSGGPWYAFFPRQRSHRPFVTHTNPGVSSLDRAPFHRRPDPFFFLPAPKLLCGRVLPSRFSMRTGLIPPSPRLLGLALDNRFFPLASLAGPWLRPTVLPSSGGDFRWTTCVFLVAGRLPCTRASPL